MSSILTNTSAMVALQTLKNVSQSLNKTQAEISTGKSVATARDNAAIWAISKVMESDVKGFHAISSSLDLGTATVGVARNAAEKATELLTEMKRLIVDAQGENVDRNKLQTDVSFYREQIATVVGAAQYNGLNLVNGSTGSMEVLASLDRAMDGTVTTSFISVTAQNLGLGADPAPAGAFGAGTGGVSGDGTAAAVAIDEAGSADLQIDSTNLSAGDRYVITIGDRQVAYTVTQQDMDATGADGAIAAGVRSALEGMGIEGLAIDIDSDTITIANTTGADITLTARAEAAGTGGLSALSGLDVTSTAGAQAALADIETMIQLAIDAAASFGSAQGRIDIQNDFVSSLSDSLRAGIGAMVDADMEEASARLQALQVQQQLGIQALSIANQAPQNILSLFR